MAISDGTAGDWVVTTTRNPTVTLPTHAAGDMLLVRIGWKSSAPTTDSAYCNTSGWAKIGQYRNGDVASSNGGGSVLVAAFWKVATSAAETDPVIEFDDTVSPTPGCYAAVTYTKAAGDIWQTPLGDGCSIASATSYTGTLASHIAGASGDMLDSFAVICDNYTMTVPTVTQSGLTLDTSTEYPTTALSSGTSNDISADGCNRLATAGTSSAAAVVSGTLGTARAGTGWVTRLRITPATEFNAGVATVGATAYNASAQVQPSAGVATVQTATTFGAEYAATILADSPVGYWRMGEASGYPQDSSGNAHHVTATYGTPTYSQTGALTGDSDTAIDVHRTTDAYKVPYTEFQLGDTWTVEAWLKRDDLNSATFYWYWGNRPGSGDGWMLGFNASGAVQLYVYYNSGASSQTIYLSTETFEDTSWHHIVVTKSGSTTTAYGDGVALTKSEGTDYTLPSNYTTDWGLGNAGYFQGSSSFDGLLDELAVYSTALTLAQIEAHHTVATTGGGGAVAAHAVVAPVPQLATVSSVANAATIQTSGVTQMSAGVATSSASASPASVQIVANAGHAAVGVAAANATATAVQHVTANAGVATVGVAAAATSAAVAPQAGLAQVASTAAGASPQLAASAGLATASAVVAQPAGSIAPAAGLATVSTTALQPSVGVSPTASPAAVVATAVRSAPLVAPVAQPAVVDADAFDAFLSTAAFTVGNAQPAAVTVAAAPASVQLTQGAGTAVASVSAHDALLLVGAVAQAGSGTVGASAFGAMATIALGTQLAAASATAYNASLATGEYRVANAGSGSATTQANQASVAVTQPAGAASSSSTAWPATPSIGMGSQLAAAGATAYDATLSIQANIFASAGTGGVVAEARQPSVAVTQPTGIAAASAAAWPATLAVGVIAAAGHAAVGAAAYGTRIDLTTGALPAAVIAAANDATGIAAEALGYGNPGRIAGAVDADLRGSATEVRLSGHAVDASLSGASD